MGMSSLCVQNVWQDRSRTWTGVPDLGSEAHSPPYSSLCEVPGPLCGTLPAPRLVSAVRPPLSRPPSFDPPPAWSSGVAWEVQTLTSNQIRPWWLHDASFAGHVGVRFHGPDTFITAQSLCRKRREGSRGWWEIYHLNSGSDRPWSEMSWILGGKGSRDRARADLKHKFWESSWGTAGPTSEEPQAALGCNRKS